MNKAIVTAHEIKRELRKQLESQKNGSAARWAVLEELRLGTGFSRSGVSRSHCKSALAQLRRLQRAGETHIGGRTPLPIDEEITRWEGYLNDADRDRRESRIDLFALDCWSAGRDGNPDRRAYEIKVDRGDLKRELDDPGKRAPWLEVVTGFYIVVPKGLATAAEIVEQAPECGVIYYARVEKPDPSICDCEQTPNEPAAYKHSFGCTFKDEDRKWIHRRAFNTARPAMKLDGAEPSWGLVASILRGAA